MRVLKKLLCATTRRVSETGPGRRLYVWQARRAGRLPSWFGKDARPEELFDGEAALRSPPHEPFLYVPWIRHHGDVLFERLREAGAPLSPLPIFRDLAAEGQRKRIIRFVRRHPDVYRRVLRRILVPIAADVRALLLSFDWSPPQRQLVYVCRELGIPTVLVPHEGVFATRDDFYRDVVNGVDYPICDEAWVWGALHAEIFAERGYPRERITIVGSPKLDACVHHRATASRASFADAHGLRPDAPIVLFAMQPLDNQFDEYAALRAQNRAIEDLVEITASRRAQLLVRGVPAGHRVLDAATREALERSPHAALDEGPRYRSSAEDAIRHADVVVSVNSTMLFEAILAGRPALSTRYVPFRQIWTRIGLPAAEDRDALAKLLDDALAGGPSMLDEVGLDWAKHAFSVGAFDGNSAARIVDRMRSFPTSSSRSSEAPYAHLFSERAESPNYGTIGLHRALHDTMRHLPAMLGFRELIAPTSPDEAARCDVFAKWGIRASKSKALQDRYAHALGRPQLILEDGFLRSIDIGLSGTPGLSVIVDDKTAHFDARRPSRLEERLNGASELSPEQHARALACMEQIRSFRVSKYNHAPDRSLGLGPGARAVLLVDQRYGDDSVLCGLADDASFVAMLDEAFSRFPDHHVVVKRHPDATRGERRSYFSDDRLFAGRDSRRIVTVDFEVNPHSLFEQVEEVFVVSSGMGFEALLAGKRVHCFGAPFYSNWGVTADRVRVPRRTRRRSIVELFHFAYIEASRYFDPARGTVGELEDTIAYIASRTGRSNSRPRRSSLEIRSH